MATRPRVKKVPSRETEREVVAISIAPDMKLLIAEARFAHVDDEGWPLSSEVTGRPIAIYIGFE
jgi:hypothetical protein